MKPIPLSDEEIAALDAATQLPCPVPKWDVAFRLKRGLWHLLSVPDLVDLYTDPSLRETIIGIIISRIDNNELAQALGHPNQEVRLMGITVFSRIPF